MDLNPGKKKIKASASVKPMVDEWVLSMYDRPPVGDLSLQQFEQYALDRLHVLKAIDGARASGKKGKELSEIIKAADAQYGLQKDSKKDHVSHFTLRLAYCKSEELRLWFLKTELALFTNRVENATAHQKEQFMQETNLGYTPVVIEDEDEDVVASLKQLEKSLSSLDTPAELRFYKAPFQDVFKLVAQRKVVMVNGIAYVRHMDVVALIEGHFRRNLSRSLAEYSRSWSQKEEAEKERLGPMLRGLTNAYLGPSYSKGGAHGRITIDQLDMLAQRSFPLCMKHMHMELREKHHLKNGARMQFGLFLKGIGVTMEDALTFWRQEFTKNMPDDKFEKNYAYSIRHTFGQEGKRTDYTPYSCMKIIQSAPGAGDCHGCPYRHWDESHLEGALSHMKISPAKVRGILEVVKGGHFQIACHKTFEATHPGHVTDTLAVPHPNSYFDESVSFYNPKAKGEKEDSAPSDPAAAAAPAAEPMEVSAA